MTTVSDLTIHRTPNPNCDACLQRVWHNESEWKTFHPRAGHGFVPEQGWCMCSLCMEVYAREALLPAGVSMKHAAPVAGSTPLEATVAKNATVQSDKPLFIHSEDAGEFLCRSGYGVFTQQRLAVTCPRCLEILNR